MSWQDGYAVCGLSVGYPIQKTQGLSVAAVCLQPICRRHISPHLQLSMTRSFSKVLQYDDDNTGSMFVTCLVLAELPESNTTAPLYIKQVLSSFLELEFRTFFWHSLTIPAALTQGFSIKPSYQEMWKESWRPRPRRPCWSFRYVEAAMSLCRIILHCQLVWCPWINSTGHS